MKTHYDVLGLDRNCSAKEIKEAFIRLSKKYHPDKNKSSDAHRRFVEVNEAYSVLGKPSSRHMYDQTLSYQIPRMTQTTSTYRSYETMKTPYEYYSEMCASRRRRHQDMNQGYFNATKLRAICFCFLLMAVGSGLQIIAESRRRAVHSHRIATVVKEAREKRLQQMKRQKEMHQALEHETKIRPSETDSFYPENP